MKYRRSRHFEENAHLERWLISYADYMTLMFALFVVLYAFALAKEENYRYLTESLSDIFHLAGPAGQESKGADLLLAKDSLSEIEQHHPGLLPESGSDPVEGDSQLVNLDKPLAGTPFSSMKEQLSTDLLELIEEGYVNVDQKDDWLTIELSSGLLFGSGSAAPRGSTRQIIQQILQTVGKANNYIRVRGYTDNQPINNELYQSNWQLSVARATAIVEVMQSLGVAPPRLAIEGYGEFQPKDSNDTVQGRANNRRVVIALSRFGWQPPVVEEPVVPAKTLDKDLAVVAPDEDEIRVIELPNGGLRITTRKEN